MAPRATKPDAEEVRERIQAAQKRAEPRNEIYAGYSRLRENEHDFDLPPGTPNVHKLHTGHVSAQLDLISGTLMKRPMTRVYTTSGDTRIKAQTSEIEKFDAHLPDVLDMQQQSSVFSQWKDDMLVYGMGVCNFQYLPSLLAAGKNGMPDPKAYDQDSPDDATRYERDRETAIGLMGTTTGRLPFVWRWCPVQHVMWNVDPERGLTEIVEIRSRRVLDLYHDDRYKPRRGYPGLRGLRDIVDGLHGSDRAAVLAGGELQFVVLEDERWCHYYTLPFVKPTDLKYSDTAAIKAYEILGNTYAHGELADSIPNKLGRPHYVLMPGKRANSSNPTMQTRGIVSDSAELVVWQDNMLSAAATGWLNWAFAPAYLKSMLGPDGVPLASTTNPDGSPKKISLKSGFHELEAMPAGLELAFATNPMSQDALMQWLFQLTDKKIDMHGMPQGVISPDGDPSGYQYNSRIQNLMIKYEPYIGSIQTSWVQFIKLVHDVMLHEVKEPLKIAAPTGKAKERDSEWFTLDPKKIKGAGELNIVAIYGEKQDFDGPDMPMRLQAYNQAVAGGDMAALSVERAREQILHVEDSDVIDDELLVESVKRSDMVKQIQQWEVLKEFLGQLRDKMQAMQTPSEEDFQGASPGLNAAYGQSVTPGTPQADAFAKFNQTTQPPASAPTTNGPGAPPRAGGRRAPAMTRPGGPNRQAQSVAP